MTAWDLFTGQSKVLLARPPSPCIAGVVTNHGQFFVLVRNLATRQTEAWLEDSSQPSRESWARALAEAYNTCPCVQSPDGKLVASGATDFSVTVTTLDDPPVVRKLLGHKLPLFSVVFSSDSRWLASGSWDSTTRVWDLAGDGRCVHTLRHRGGVIAVQFTPDGRTLVTADRDQTYFWNLQTGQEMMVLSGRPIVWWLTVSAWVVPPESDDGFLIQCPDGTGRFTPVPSLRSIDAEIQQGLSRSP